MKIKDRQLLLITKELMKEFFPDCTTVPKLEITYDPDCIANTRHVAAFNNTIIEINDYLLNDLEKVIQVLMHELIHHVLYCRGSKEIHGDQFRKEADRLNSILGDSYIGIYGSDTAWR